MLNKIRILLDKIKIFILTLKYWMQGDPWKEAKEFATVIVTRWRK